MPEGSCCGWPFNEVLVNILVTTLSVAFPFIEYYSMEALAEHALALKHQHLWCLIVSAHRRILGMASVVCVLVKICVSISHSTN